MRSLPAVVMSRLVGALPAELAAESLAAALPASSGFGFELSLSGHAPGMDISVRIEPFDGSFAYIEAPPLAAAVCHLWKDPAATHAKATDTLWLEYDDAGSGASCREPSVAFCRLTQEFNTLADGEALDFLDLLQHMAEADRPHPERRQLAHQVFLCLRPVAPLRHIGFPLARPTRDLRLCFSVERGSLGLCLDRLGQSDRKAELLALTRTLAPEQCEIVLHLDIGPTLGPRIGLELMPVAQAGWDHLLTGLLAQGLCDSQDVLLIRRWPFSPPILDAPPASLSRKLPDPARWHEATVLRRPNHVKLSTVPGKAVTAKVYLFAGLLWDHAEAA
jgi:hypothetical protein